MQFSIWDHDIPRQGWIPLNRPQVSVARQKCMAPRLRSGEYVGKSTLLNLIARLDRPDQGRLVLDGVDYAQLQAQALTPLASEDIAAQLDELEAQRGMMDVDHFKRYNDLGARHMLGRTGRFSAT